MKSFKSNLITTNRSIYEKKKKTNKSKNLTYPDEETDLCRRYGPEKGQIKPEEDEKTCIFSLFFSRK